MRNEPSSICHGRTSVSRTTPFDPNTPDWLTLRPYLLPVQLSPIENSAPLLALPDVRDSSAKIENDVFDVIAAFRFALPICVTPSPIENAPPACMPSSCPCSCRRPYDNPADTRPVSA